MTGIGQKLTEVAAVGTFGLGLTALFLGINQWWLIFVVGWFLVTPLLAILTEGPGDAVGEAIEEEVERSIRESVRDSTPGSSSRARDADGEATADLDPEDALDVLRERYARGEIDEIEFERKVERLLETESLDDAEMLLGGSGDAASGESGGSGERETDDDREPATERS